MVWFNVTVGMVVGEVVGLMRFLRWLRELRGFMRCGGCGVSR